MSKKKKTYDQKIEEYTEKLKIAQRERRKSLLKKKVDNCGLN
ncbi:hypothetical protein [Fusobacterium animalis]